MEPSSNYDNWEAEYFAEREAARAERQKFIDSSASSQVTDTNVLEEGVVDNSNNGNSNNPVDSATTSSQVTDTKADNSNNNSVIQPQLPQTVDNKYIAKPSGLPDGTSEDVDEQKMKEFEDMLLDFMNKK
jgi:hypothetical protein